MSMTRFKRVQQWMLFARQWHLMDATHQDLDKVGARVAEVLAGKHKPIFHPETDCGDHVIVYNCQHVAMRAFDWKHRDYYYDNEYPKSKAYLPAHEIHRIDPCRLLFISVYAAMVDLSPVRRRNVERLHLFANDDVPAELMANVSNQLEQVQRVPRHADDYSEAERRAFPEVVCVDQPDHRPEL